MMTKDELLAELRASRNQLEAALEGLEPEDFVVAGVMDSWTLKDLLAHLNRWEGECVTMLFDLLQGRKPSRASVQGMDWVDQLNATWHEQDSLRALPLVLGDFRGLRKQTLRRVEQFSQDDLTEVGRYQHLGEDPLWRWIAVDTYEHEQEHLAAIQAWRDQRLG